MTENVSITRQHKFFDLAEDVKILAEPLFAHLKISYFAFKRTFADGSKIYLFNNPDYYEHYFSKEYFLIGNREGDIRKYSSSYDLWDYLPDPYEIYNEAAKSFNIAHGLTITRKKKDFCDFFFFAAKTENSSVKQLYLNKREVLEYFCDYFLDKADAIIHHATNSKILLPYVGSFEDQANDFHTKEFIKILSKDQSKLTKRESDCAYYLTQGKSNKEIAKGLNISPRTVEDYINSIRSKTNCKSKSELISLLCKWPLEVIQNF